MGKWRGRGSQNTSKCNKDMQKKKRKEPVISKPEVCTNIKQKLNELMEICWQTVTEKSN